jgi:N,N'-diacetyllegionaminate synthase
MTEKKIANRNIGDGNSCMIIAEAGINHNGNVELAKELIRDTATTGADVVKFQIYWTEEFCSKNNKYYDLFKNIEFTEEEWIELADYAKSQKIIFSASVFGEKSADILERIGSPFFKIASGDITDIPLINYIAGKQKPIILSTGIASIAEIDDALNAIYETGNRKAYLLHCISNYPAKYEDTNLRAIQTLKNVFHIPVGFSDHTPGTFLPPVAVAVGADIIEKHITLDKNLPGPDHKLSLDIQEFKKMISCIRAVEAALGSGIKKPTSGELKVKTDIRRSINARGDIRKGSIITKENIQIVRPARGIHPKFIDLIIGKTAVKNIKSNEPLDWDAI